MRASLFTSRRYVFSADNVATPASLAACHALDHDYMDAPAQQDTVALRFIRNGGLYSTSPIIRDQARRTHRHAACGAGARSLFHCIPSSVLFSLFSHGLCLFLTPPVNSPSNDWSGIGAVATATAADCARPHVSGGLMAGAEIWIWAGVSQLRHRACRVSLVLLSLRPRTGVVFCRCAFVLLRFAAASGHGTMVLSVGWPPVLLLPRTGRSFFFFIESCSSVCYRVTFLLLCVFSFFSVLSP